MPIVIAAAIAGGAAIYGAHKAASSNTDAAEISSDAVQKGIDLQGRMYDQDRADNATLRQLGNGAANNLGYLAGIDMTAPTKDPSAATPPPYVVPGAKDAKGNPFPGASTTPEMGNAPGFPVMDRPIPQSGSMRAPRPSNLSQLSQPPAQGGMVKVRSPQGMVGMIPASMLEHALAAGGQQVA